MEIRYEISNDTAMANMSTVASSICAHLQGREHFEDQMYASSNVVSISQGDRKPSLDLIKVNSTKLYNEASTKATLAIEVMIIKAAYFHEAYEDRGGLHGFVEELTTLLQRIEKGLNARSAKHMHPFKVTISIRVLV